MWWQGRQAISTASLSKRLLLASYLYRFMIKEVRLWPTQLEINNVFKHYYKDLYSSEHDVNTPKIESFFDKLSFPSVPHESNSSLGGEISIQEILQAIKSLKKQAMFNEFLSSRQLPPTLQQAAITLIPKKDPLQCASYHPISLLNVDYKILSKILVVRLEKLVPQIISTHQTNFILNRHSSSDLRRLLNIVCSPSNSVPEMVISLDAEKAFDQVEWTYWSRQLGFDEAFISWIKLYYVQPLAGVITNGQQFEYFSLEPSRLPTVTPPLCHCDRAISHCP